MRLGKNHLASANKTTPSIPHGCAARKTSQALTRQFGEFAPRANERHAFFLHGQYFGDVVRPAVPGAPAGVRPESAYQSNQTLEFSLRGNADYRSAPSNTSERPSIFTLSPSTAAGCVTDSGRVVSSRTSQRFFRKSTGRTKSTAS